MTRPFERASAQAWSWNRDQQAAVHYVWGWQDREGEADSLVAFNFGQVWAMYRMMYGAEVLWCMSSMRKAWDDFVRDGYITVMNGSGEWVIVAGVVVPHILPVPNVKPY